MLLHSCWLGEASWVFHKASRVVTDGCLDEAAEIPEEKWVIVKCLCAAGGGLVPAEGGAAEFPDERRDRQGERNPDPWPITLQSLFNCVSPPLSVRLWWWWKHKSASGRTWRWSSHFEEDQQRSLWVLQSAAYQTHVNTLTHVCVWLRLWFIIPAFELKISWFHCWTLIVTTFVTNVSKQKSVLLNLRVFLGSLFLFHHFISLMFENLSHAIKESLFF